MIGELFNLNKKTLDSQKETVYHQSLLIRDNLFSDNLYSGYIIA